MNEFSANRSLSAEARLRALEDYLAENFRLDTAAEEQADTLGGGTAAVVAAGGGGGGGSGSTSLAGDVTGPAGANVVGQVQGVPFTDPVAGDDGQFLRYTHAGPTLSLEPVHRIQDKDIAAPGAAQNLQAVVWDNASDDFVYRALTSLTLLGAWTSADISLLGTVDVEILNTDAGDTVLSIPMPRAGALVAISIKLSGDVDGGAGAGNNFTATAYKNGVSTVLTATVAGGAGTENEAVATVTPVAFAAGDDITVFAKETGAAAAVRASVWLWGRFDAF